MITKRDISGGFGAPPVWQYMLSVYEYHNRFTLEFSSGEVKHYYGGDDFNLLEYSDVIYSDNPTPPKSLWWKFTPSLSNWTLYNDNCYWCHCIDKGHEDEYKPDYMIWTNFDLHYWDGDLYCAASVPVSTAPKYSPTLISRTHSFTDTTVITEVTLMGLDPSKIYEVYWAIYDDTGDLLSHGVSDQIGEITGVETATGFSRIVNLQPGTTYSLYWHLAENDSVLDTTFSNTVTTLGLAPGGTGDSGNSGSSGGSAGSGGMGSDFTGGEDDISGSQGDGNTGILMQILNKLSAIFDFLTGDKEVEDTPEQALKDATSDVTQAVADTIFGENSTIKPTVDTVTDVASVGTVGKSLFSSNVSIGDFLGLLGDSSLLSWFSEETASDLNSVSSVATYGLRDEFSESNRIYQRDKAILYEFAGIGGAA